jgi:hypothetical protein
LSVAFLGVTLFVKPHHHGALGGSWWFINSLWWFVLIILIAALSPQTSWCLKQRVSRQSRAQQQLQNPRHRTCKVHSHPIKSALFLLRLEGLTCPWCYPDLDPSLWGPAIPHFLASVSPLPFPAGANLDQLCFSILPTCSPAIPRLPLLCVLCASYSLLIPVWMALNPVLPSNNFL